MYFWRKFSYSGFTNLVFLNLPFSYKFVSETRTLILFILITLVRFLHSLTNSTEVLFVEPKFRGRDTSTQLRGSSSVSMTKEKNKSFGLEVLIINEGSIICS